MKLIYVIEFTFAGGEVQSDYEALDYYQSFKCLNQADYNLQLSLYTFI